MNGWKYQTVRRWGGGGFIKIDPKIISNLNNSGRLRGAKGCVETLTILNLFSLKVKETNAPKHPSDYTPAWMCSLMTI